MTTVPFKTQNVHDKPVESMMSGRAQLCDHFKTRQRVFVLVYVVLMLTGLAAVMLIPGRYRTEAVVQVLSPDNMPRKLTTSDAQSYQDAVKSPAVLELAASRIVTGTGLVGAKASEQVRLLQQTISVSVDVEKGRLLVSAQSDRPERAALLANLTAEAFVETEKKHAETRRKELGPELAGRAGLARQRREVEKSREKAGNELAAFDEQTLLVYGNNDLESVRSGIERKLSRAKTQLDLANIRLASFTTSLGLLEKELQGIPESVELPVVAAEPNPARDALVAEIAQAERELAAVRKRFTDMHPLVIEKDSLIAQKKQDLAKMGGSPGTVTRATKPNPRYLQARQNVDQTKLKVREARQQVGVHERELKQAQERLAGMSERPTRRRALLAEVTRTQSGLDRIDKQLAQTEQRLAGLEAGLVVSELTRRAPVPTTSSGPERDWWTLVVFLTAVAGATGATVGMHVLDSSYASAWELERHLKLPVLGSVSHVEVEGRRRRRAAVRLGVSLTTVLLLAGLLLVVLLFAM